MRSQVDNMGAKFMHGFIHKSLEVFIIYNLLAKSEESETFSKFQNC